MTSTSITYLPSPEQPRLTLDGGREMLERFVGLECARLTEAGRAASQADLVVVTDSAGLATSVELVNSTGDERVDGVVGAVTAQLDLGPTAAASRTALRAGYSCADGKVTATLALR